MAYCNPDQGQPQGQYPAPIMYLAAPAMTNQAEATKNYGPHYAREASIGLGGTQIVLACISFAAGITVIVYASGQDYMYSAIGIGCGVLYLIAGSIAIAAGKEPKNNLIIATLVFSIFDFLCGIGQLVMGGIGVFASREVGFANSLMVGVASLEIIFGITMTAISARAIDNGSRAQVFSVPVYYTPSMQETVQMDATTLQHMTYPPTEKAAAYDAVQRTPETNEEHLYETLHHNNFEHMKF